MKRKTPCVSLSLSNAFRLDSASGRVQIFMGAYLQPSRLPVPREARTLYNYIQCCGLFAFKLTDKATRQQAARRLVPFWNLTKYAPDLRQTQPRPNVRAQTSARLSSHPWSKHILRYWARSDFCHSNPAMWDTSDFDYDFSSPFEVSLENLPQFLPRFSIPTLENKPQNPIMDTLKLEKMNAEMPKRHFQPELLPPELALFTLDTDRSAQEEKSRTGIEELWNNAVNRELGVQVCSSNIQKRLRSKSFIEWDPSLG